jgi:uncharacterized protein YjhX (UPF0386 family)
MLISEKRRKSLYAILALILMVSVPLQADYIWPLPASKELTSNFCAYRGGHYHAGIDIRTFRKTGYNVVAIEDGCLWRVATNWWGYGRVVYLKLDDGRIAVYAHLSRFAPQIEQYVRENQLIERRYKVNLFPERDQFRFKKGDMIGKSGQSGVGAPHLHFEIRTPDNQPVNPLEFYSMRLDNRAPRFEEITFRPLEGVGLANGKYEPLTVKFDYNQAQEGYTFNQIPLLYGKVGIEVKAADYRNNVKRKYNVAGLRFYLDDSLVFESRYDSLSFESWHLVDMDYNLYQRIKSKSFYHNLYAPDGRKSMRQNPDPECRTCKAFPLDYNISPGIHKARIEAEDIYGNKARAEFKISISPSIELAYNPNQNPSSGSALESYFYESSSDLPLSVDLSHYDPIKNSFDPIGGMDAANLSVGNIYQAAKAEGSQYCLVKLDFMRAGKAVHSALLGLTDSPQRRFLTPELIADVDFIKNVNFTSSYPVVEIDAGNLYAFLTRNDFQANFAQRLQTGTDLSFPLSLNSPLKEHAFGEDFSRLVNHLVLEKLLTDGYCLHKRGKESEITLEGGKIHIPEDVPSDLFFKLETAAGDGGGLINEIKILPDDRLFLEKIGIFVEKPSSYPLGKTALYGISRKGEPSFTDDEWDSAGYLGGYARSFGTYRLMVDSTSPTITNIRPANGTVSGKSKPSISFNMDDDLSGFDSDTLLTVTLDGRFLPCEYDLDTKTVRANLAYKLKPGKHELNIRALDRMGNVTTKKSRFTISTK